MYRESVKIVAVVLLLGGVYLGWMEAKKPGRFPLQEIHLEGVVNSDVEEALKVIKTDKGVNLFTINLTEVKNSLLTLPWIRTVRVKRVFPNALAINLSEKIAVCMGKKDGRLHLLDEYGARIKQLEAKDPLVFPVVATTDLNRERPAKIVWLINLLGRHPWLKDRVSEATGYAGDRWVLYTKKGIKLLLSADAEKELALLLRLQKRYDILNRQVRQIELRIPGRVAVRMIKPDFEMPL
jgi:cell division protein FtsQ